MRKTPHLRGTTIILHACRHQTQLIKALAAFAEICPSCLHALTHAVGLGQHNHENIGGFAENLLTAAHAERETSMNTSVALPASALAHNLGGIAVISSSPVLGCPTKGTKWESCLPVVSPVWVALSSNLYMIGVR